MLDPVQKKESEKSKEKIKRSNGNKKAHKGLISDLGYLHQLITDLRATPSL